MNTPLEIIVNKIRPVLSHPYMTAKMLKVMSEAKKTSAPDPQIQRVEEMGSKPKTSENLIDINA